MTGLTSVLCTQFFLSVGHKINMSVSLILKPDSTNSMKTIKFMKESNYGLLCVDLQTHLKVIHLCLS